MRLFHFYIDNRQHSRPQRFEVQVHGEHRAREIAEAMLRESDDHLGVEVCEEGRRLFGLGTFSTRTCCAREEADDGLAA